MKFPEPDDERPLAWNAILDLTPVYSSDGEEVGRVHEVVGAEDIFHGVVVKHGVLGHEVMVPAAQVGTITNKRIDLKMTAEQVRELEPYQPEASYELGFKGLFRKHLAWTDDRETHDRGEP